MSRMEKTSSKRMLSWLLTVVLCLTSLVPATIAFADGGELHITAGMLDDASYRVKSESYETLIVDADVGAARIVLDDVKVANLVISGGSPSIDLFGATVDKVTVTEQSGVEQLVAPVLHVDALSHVGLAQVEGDLQLIADQAGIVDEVKVLSGDNLKLDAPVRLLSVEAPAWVQVRANVEELKASAAAYVSIEDYAVVGKVDIAAMDVEQAPLYIDTAYQTQINDVVCAGRAVLGGVGYVERIQGEGSSDLEVDITVTNATGDATSVTAEEGQVSYISSVLLPMEMTDLADMYLANGGAEQNVKLEALNAYGDLLNEYDVAGTLLNPAFAVSVEDESVASARIENDQLIVAPKGMGSTVVMLTAELAGFSKIRQAVAVRVFDAPSGKNIVPLSVSVDEPSMSVKATKETIVALNSNEKNVEYRVHSSNPVLLEARMYHGEVLMVGNGQGPAKVTVQATKAADESNVYLPTTVEYDVFVLPVYSTQLDLQTDHVRDLTVKQGGTATVEDITTLPEDADITVTSSTNAVGAAIENGVVTVTANSELGEAAAAAITVVASRETAQRADGKTVEYLPDVFKFVVIVERDKVTLTLDGVNIETVKEYDGTTDVAFTQGELGGVAEGDDVRLVVEAKYNDKDAGQDKTITVTYTLEGKDAGKYTAPENQTVPGIITPKKLKVSVDAQDRVFEENNREVDLLSPSLNGVISGDDVKVTGYGIGKMDDANAGKGKIVRISGLTLTGKDAKNYDISWAKTYVNIGRAEQAPLYVTSPNTTKFHESYTLTTKGGSGGGAVTYAIVGGTGKAKIEGDKLIPVQSGTIIVVATKGVDRNYNHVMSAPYTITIEKGEQDPLFINSPTGTIMPDVPSYVLTTKGGSGTGAVTYTMVAGGSAPGGAVSGTGVACTGIGTILVQATKAGDANYDPTTSPVFTLNIAIAYQKPLKITSPATHVFGTNYTITHTGGSGTGAETYSIVPGGTATVTLTLPDQLVIQTAGTILIQVDKAGDSYYAPATSPVFTVTVTKKVPGPYPTDPNAIHITSATTHPFGTQYNITTSGGYGTGAITFAIKGGTGVGTLSNGGNGPILTITKAGTFNLVATQAADNDYAQASSPVHALVVTPLTQTITIDSPTTHVYGTDYTVTSQKGPGTGAVTYAITGGTGVGTITGDKLKITTAGTFILEATQAADANYTVATSAPHTVTVSKAPQPTDPDPNALKITSATSHEFGTPYTITTTGGLGTGALTFAILGGTGVGTLSNSGTGPVLTVTTAGTFQLQATKAADANYEQGTSPVHVLTVSPKSQIVKITSGTTHVFGTDYEITSTSGAGTGAVTYAIVGGTGVGTITGNMLNITTVGTFQLQATQAADANYQVAYSAIHNLTVTKAPQPKEPDPNALRITSSHTHVYGTTYTIVTAGGLGTGARTFSILPGGTGVGTLSGAVLTVTKAGTFNLQAEIASDANYEAGISAPHLLTVSPDAQTIVIDSSSQHTFGSPYTVTSTPGVGTGAITFAIVPGGTGVGTLNGAVLTITKAGTFNLQANKAADANYTAAQSAVFLLTVDPASQTVEFTSPNAYTYDPANPYVMTATSGIGTGAITFEVVAGGTGTATVAADGKTLVITKAGTINLKVTQAADANYQQATDTMTLTVSKAKQPNSITITSATSAPMGQPYNITTTGGNGLGQVTFTIVSGAGTISGSQLNPAQEGVIVIKATKAADDLYEQAESLPHSVTFSKGEQKTKLEIVAPAKSVVFDTAGYTMNTTGGDGTGQVTYNLSSGPAGIVGNKLTPTQIGTVVITATKAGDSTYNSQTSDPYTIQVRGYAPRNITVDAQQVLDLDVNYRFLYNLSGSATVAPGDTVTYSYQIVRPVGKGSYTAPSYNASTAAGTTRLALGDYTVVLTATNGDTNESDSANKAVTVTAENSKSNSATFGGYYAEMESPANLGLYIIEYDFGITTTESSPGSPSHNATYFDYWNVWTNVTAATAPAPDVWNGVASPEPPTPNIHNGGVNQGSAKYSVPMRHITGTFARADQISSLFFRYQIDLTHSTSSGCLGGNTYYMIKYYVENNDASGTGPS